MKVSRGEIVEVNFLLPGEQFKPHPVLILSDINIHDYEDCFICVMISGKDTDDEFSFHINDNMLIKPAKKKCQVRCHLLTFVPNKQIIQKISIMKKKYVDMVAEQIFTNCLSAI
ncbi:MAG: type II toxin-antitoxin system PemK/MazF family toxin [Bacteroidia bacterium]|nr:type II toxin-antitoxin system PemK/MazF family toxin [Bacteroidia bacterium]